VQDAVNDSRDFAEAHGIKIAADIEDGIPEVGVEERQIVHVFSNFISNAVKHSPRGEKVIVQARKHEGGVRFAVIDKGPGISAQNQPRVFDKFFRVPGSDRNGAGLGLSIAREIVHAHHGSAGVKSKPGEGSEFFFILPEFQKEKSI
jgi:signal transduction histidine kinase